MFNTQVWVDSWQPGESHSHLELLISKQWYWRSFPSSRDLVISPTTSRCWGRPGHALTTCNVLLSAKWEMLIRMLKNKLWCVLTTDLAGRALQMWLQWLL